MQTSFIGASASSAALHPKPAAKDWPHSPLFMPTRPKRTLTALALPTPHQQHSPSPRPKPTPQQPISVYPFPQARPHPTTTLATAAAAAPPAAAAAAPASPAHSRKHTRLDSYTKVVTFQGHTSAELRSALAGLPEGGVLDLQGSEVLLDAPLELVGPASSLTISNGTLLLVDAPAGRRTKAAAATSPACLVAAAGATLRLLRVHVRLVAEQVTWRSRAGGTSSAEESSQEMDDDVFSGPDPRVTILASDGGRIHLTSCTLDGDWALGAVLLAASGAGSTATAARCALLRSSRAVHVEAGGHAALQACALRGYESAGVRAEGRGSAAALRRCCLQGVDDAAFDDGMRHRGAEAEAGVTLCGGATLRATACTFEGNGTDVHCEGGSVSELDGCDLGSGGAPTMRKGLVVVDAGSRVAARHCRLCGGVHVARGGEVELEGCVAAPGALRGVEASAFGGRIRVLDGCTAGGGSSAGAGGSRDVDGDGECKEGGSVWSLGSVASSSVEFGSGSGSGSPGSGPSGSGSDHEELQRLRRSAARQRSTEGQFAVLPLPAAQ